MKESLIYTLKSRKVIASVVIVFIDACVTLLYPVTQATPEVVSLFLTNSFYIASVLVGAQFLNDQISRAMDGNDQKKKNEENSPD